MTKHHKKHPSSHLPKFLSHNLVQSRSNSFSNPSNPLCTYVVLCRPYPACKYKHAASSVNTYEEKDDISKNNYVIENDIIKSVTEAYYTNY